jgi:hypothetical protein
MNRLVIVILLVLVVTSLSYAAPPDDRQQSAGGPYVKPAADYRCIEDTVAVGRDGERVKGVVCIPVSLKPVPKDPPQPADSPADR